MTKDKETLDKSVEILSANAAEASELAKVQRKTADAQHVVAHKLEKLSDKLSKGAAVLKEKSKATPK